MKNCRLHPSFKARLVAMISLFNICLVLCLSCFSYLWHSRQFTRQTINQTQQIIEQTGANIDNYIDELFRLTLAPYFNDEVMAQIAASSETPLEMLAGKRIIENFLSSVMTLPRTEILRVYILTENDIFSYTRTPYQMAEYDSYKTAPWYAQALSSNAPVFIPIHSEKAFGEKRTQIFSIARRLRSKENNAHVLGVIKVDADYTGIKNICDKVRLEHEGTLFVINTDGETVYQSGTASGHGLLSRIAFPVREGDFTCILDKERYIVNITTMDHSGLKLIALHSLEALTAPARTNLSRTIVLALTCIVVSIVILILFIQHFLHPLFHIIDSMKVVQTGNLAVQVPVQKQDEIGYLASAFNTMIKNLASVIENNLELERKVYEAQYLQKVSQYDALCSQVKPHFLYNILNTISLLIKCNEYRDAVQCIENLSCFLRGIMNTDKEITLTEELSLVSSYLDLQKIRYGDKLTYVMNVPEAARTLRLPALSLQPIVENTIKHCCEASSNPIHIHIYSEQEKDLLILRIRDDGPGIRPQSLDSLLTALQSDGSSSKTGSLDTSIGLLNVHRRLRLHFGSRSGLQITSCQEGTVISLIIPDPPSETAVSFDS